MKDLMLMKNITVIIPARNRPEPLKPVVWSLLDEFAECRIIIADSGSMPKVRDFYIEQAEVFGCTYLNVEYKGTWNKSRVVNTAFKWMQSISPTEYVCLWDIDKIAGWGYGEWVFGLLDELQNGKFITTRALRVGPKGCKVSKAQLSDVGPTPQNWHERRDFFNKLYSGAFKGMDDSAPLAEMAYGFVLTSKMFESVQGQEERIPGYWQDDADLYYVLKSQGYEAIGVPRKHGAFHIPHGTGTRAPIFNKLRQLHVERKKLYEAGKKLISNETKDSWGDAELVAVADYYQDSDLPSKD